MSDTRLSCVKCGHLITLGLKSGANADALIDAPHIADILKSFGWRKGGKGWQCNGCTGIVGRAGREFLKRVENGRISAKIGRNEPCPCGSGQKYKRCCGEIPI